MPWGTLKSKIEEGQIWVHKKTGKKVYVVETPENTFAAVRLLHPSGKKTTKQQHYFIYEYRQP